MKNATVLVTGGTGFIASYCILALLQSGFQVRTTMRSLKRVPDVQGMLRQGGITSFEALSYVEADLAGDKGWTEAVAGCTYVIHVASPTPNIHSKNENDFIKPAVNGVLRVLRAARDAGVKRVVLTSAFGAVGFGINKTTPYTENDWSNPEANIPPYQKSKTLAEKAAWEFIKNEGKGMELSAVNPVGVLGPVLSGDYSHSIQLIHRMMKGEMSGCPKISSGYVDVRDVADLHVKAMLSPAANGERFLAVAGEAISLLDIANILRTKAGAAKAPAKELPDWLFHVLGLFNKDIRNIIPLLGMAKSASNEKARRLLGWQPGSNEEAILATANSLIQLNLV